LTRSTSADEDEFDLKILQCGIYVKIKIQKKFRGNKREEKEGGFTEMAFAL
jgi:hypothetical protein